MTTQQHPPSLSGGIDHIHVYVRSRAEAADWYRSVLGFDTVDTYSRWAEDPSGPLVIEDPGKRIHLALFARQESKPVSIAFGANAQEYLAWRDYLDARELATQERDHDLSWSLYFTDPFANQIEITTYDVQQVRQVAQSALRKPTATGR